MNAEEWPIIELRDVLAEPIQNGYSPTESQEWTGVQMLGLGCLTGNGFEPLQLKNGPRGIPAHHRSFLNDGDLLVSRANTRQLVGLAGVYRNIGTPCLYPDLMMRVRVNEQMYSAKFLELVLRQSGARHQVMSMAQGTSENMVKISQDEFGGLKIPMPPLAEQLHVVEVVEALAEQERVIEAAISKARLVRHEVALDLLSCQDAMIVALGDVAAVSSGGTPSRARPDYWVGGTLPWVRTSEINFNVIHRTAEQLSRKGVVENGLRVYDPGTVLLAMYGEGVTRGRSAILGIPAAVNQAAAAIVCDSTKIDYRYLYYWLAVHYAEIRKSGQGSNQTNLSTVLVADIRLPLPSLQEQRRLVACLEKFDTKLKSDMLELEKLRSLRHAVVDDLLSRKRKRKRITA